MQNEELAILNEVAKINKHVQKHIENMPPREMSLQASMLATYLGNIADLQVQAELAFNREWVTAKARGITDGNADRVARTTEAYERKKKLELIYDATVHLINALKKRLDLYGPEKAHTSKI